MSSLKAPKIPHRGTGRPATYKLANGTRVPGVTTIVNRFKDSGGLVHWAWTQGRDGLDYRNTRDAAADTGKIAHQWIEDYIHGADRTPFPAASKEQLAGAESGFTAFLDWATQVNLEIVATEIPLLSEQYAFGGTLDAIALVAGKLVLFDWKTSNGVYADYVAQIAAYRQLIHENAAALAPHVNVSLQLPESARLLRFGKEHADFHDHSYPKSVLDLGWDFFLHARAAYDLDAKLKKVAA